MVDSSAVPRSLSNGTQDIRTRTNRGEIRHEIHFAQGLGLVGEGGEKMSKPPRCRQPAQQF